jgi:hypothetical protein
VTSHQAPSQNLSVFAAILSLKRVDSDGNVGTRLERQAGSEVSQDHRSAGPTRVRQVYVVLSPTYTVQLIAYVDASPYRPVPRLSHKIAVRWRRKRSLEEHSRRSKGGKTCQRR